MRGVTFGNARRGGRAVRTRRSGLRRAAFPLAAAGLATLAAALAQTLFPAAFLASWEQDALQMLLARRAARAPDPRLALVAVDSPMLERDTEAAALVEERRGPALERYRPAGCRCAPAPRRAYARAVERLARWGAAAVVLDLMFRAPCPEEDGILGEALFRAGNVAIPACAEALPYHADADPRRTADLLFRPPVLPARAAVVGSPALFPAERISAVELRQTLQHRESGQFAEFGSLAWEAVCMAEGWIPWETERCSPYLADGAQPRLLGGLFPHRPRAAAGGAGGAGGAGVEVRALRGEVAVDRLAERKCVLINYAAGSGTGRGRYRQSRLSHLLACSESEGTARYRDRLVLIGDPAADQKVTLAGKMPGTEVLASAAATLLPGGRPLRVVPAGWVLLLMLGGAAVGAALVRETPPRIAAAGVLLLGGGIAALAQLLLARDWWLFVASPLAAMALAVGPAAAWENERIRQVVGRLVPRRVGRPAGGQAGFTVEEASVLFSDIRGYTTLSERMEPARMMAFLNEYMAGVDAVLHRHDGHFVKSPGDCVVALFASERRRASHPERAIRAGLALLEHSARFRERFRSETGLDFAVGVGIHSGPMAVGLLEARRHLEPTVIGDAVNTAARIEGLTKQYGCPLLVSEETLAPVAGRFAAEPVDEVQVKGRARPVRLFRVLKELE